MSLIKIAGRNHIFSPLGIETKLIENLLPLGLDSSPIRSVLLKMTQKTCHLTAEIQVFMTMQKLRLQLLQKRLSSKNLKP